MLHSYSGVCFQHVYQTSLLDLLTGGEKSSPRGMETKEFIPGVFQVENPLSRILTLKSRKMNLFYAMIETLWYLNGDDDVSRLTPYNKEMARFSDDGKILKGAYGARLFKKDQTLDQSQFGLVYDKLKADPSSRQALAIIWDPWKDHQKTKDVPCTIGFAFTIRNEKLDMTTMMRSNDIVLGTTYDVFAFTIFQEFLARKLGVGLGTYTHIANSFHIYSNHYDLANEMIQDMTPVMLMPEMPDTSWKMFNELYRFEASLRFNGVSQEAFNDAREFGEYWSQWALMFVLYKAIKEKNADMSKDIFYQLHQTYQKLSERWIDKLYK
jgi:thymidylate synthase